ncbi:hypothetical protein PK98_15310 [Croceibacterium mercuriale]|uniref:Uncharacterized protein n=1 Tax=Croceibacterium mercuriale TaxID=1572751 RepID=A0A0B2BX15_9SPHN|nr:hypothetical protein [Croceibacterium mercuriale]KHL24173.1 hypothetical protein PK98_15310 [Croceibacterium mercuriale]
MARRPVFVPQPDGPAPVRTEQVEFTWHPGLSLSQKRQSIAALHHASREGLGLRSVLEISSKSPDAVGVALSAFNLTFCPPGRIRPLSVECAFQGSKVFADGGPFTDLFDATSRDAKRDERLQSSGRLTGFRFMDGRDWGLEPQSAFYDWLYLNALAGRPDLAAEVLRHEAFTDIEFNPEKSINCQAYSVALFASFSRARRLQQAMRDAESFLDVVSSRPVNNARQDDTLQGSLF